MITYTEKTTQELIDLLIEEEDRVTLEHMQELAARPDAAEPLRELLLSDYYWYDENTTKYWALYHAFILLCLKRDKAALPDLLEALKKAHETDFDYLTEISHCAFAQFGESAVDALMGFINDLKSESEDDDELTYSRSNAVAALTRIGLENPDASPGIAEFLCGLMTDPTETDTTFLSFISDDVIALDRENGIEAVRSAYQRNLIDEYICGDFDSLLKSMDSEHAEHVWKYKLDVFDFYQPEEIAHRQARWKKEAEDKKRWAEKRELNAIKEQERLAFEATRPKTPTTVIKSDPVIPAGLTLTSAGSLVREEEKIGRNDPCFCGSGKKYKKCHGK